MLGIMLVSAALAAGLPSPEETAMRRSTDLQTPLKRQGPGAAQGPIPAPVSAAADPAPAPAQTAPRLAESSAAAKGRRTLSTAFVRIGPDGYLTVELRGGRVLVLRDVVMRRKDYCGVQTPADPKGARFCGSYAEVAAARAGGGPASSTPGDPIVR